MCNTKKKKMYSKWMRNLQFPLFVGTLIVTVITKYGKVLVMFSLEHL